MISPARRCCCRTLDERGAPAAAGCGEPAEARVGRRHASWRRGCAAPWLAERAGEGAAAADG